MNSFEDHPALQHFPDSIPPNATEVQFVYEPKRLQDAMYVELLMTLPLDDIEYIEDTNRGIAKHQFTATTIPNDLPEPNLYLLNNENNELDKDFYCLILDAQPAGKEDFPWNHGIYNGIGINKHDSQIIYWCQYW